MRQTTSKRQVGFTMIELMVVLVIMLIVAGIAIPNIMSAIHITKLRDAGSDVSSVSQAARIRAVQDNRFYSVRLFAGPPQQAYADIYPQSATGASGNGGTSVAALDPTNPISTEVTAQAAANAPNTANLYGQFLPAGSTLVVNDGSAAASPITFGPRGLPCAALAATGGTVCDRGGGPTAFWIFFQNIPTQAWEAVTVSPSGRIRKWLFSGTFAAGNWSPL